jgi:3-oxoacyl-[acyl-carrier-protein] synthase-3
MAPGSGLKPKIALGAGLDHSLAAVLLHRVNGPTAPMRCESAKPVDVGIIGTSYYLPPEPLSVDQLSEQVGFADGKREFYRDIQGLETVYWGRGETPFQMAYKAAKNLLDTYQVDPLSIDALIIYHTFFVISLEPRTLIGELQEKLGLRRAIGFAASGQHCASFVGALRLGKDMITTGSANRVLLVGTDSFLGSLNREMEGMSLQSEGSSAALLEAGATKNRIAGLADHIDGSFFRGIAWDDRDKQRFNLIYCLCWKRLVEGLVKRLGLTMDDISLIVPHNINRPSWMQVLHHLRYPAHKFFDANIPRCGHVCSSDLVINLTDAAAQGRLRKDDYVLLLTAGMGAGWGAIALQH